MLIVVVFVVIVIDVDVVFRVWPLFLLLHRLFPPDYFRLLDRLYVYPLGSVVRIYISLLLLNFIPFLHILLPTQIIHIFFSSSLTSAIALFFLFLSHLLVLIWFLLFFICILTSVNLVDVYLVIGFINTPCLKD